MMLAKRNDVLSGANFMVSPRCLREGGGYKNLLKNLFGKVQADFSASRECREPDPYVDAVSPIDEGVLAVHEVFLVEA